MSELPPRYSKPEIADPGRIRKASKKVTRPTGWKRGRIARLLQTREAGVTRLLRSSPPPRNADRRHGDFRV